MRGIVLVPQKNIQREAQRAQLHARALRAASACLMRECAAACTRLDHLYLTALLDLDLMRQQQNAAWSNPLQTEIPPVSAGKETAYQRRRAFTESQF